MKPIGLYLHIPFCNGKCPYCDFYSVNPESEKVTAYVDALCREIDKAGGFYDTVYFGGGTPSVMGGELLGGIIDCAKELPGVMTY